MKTKKSYAKFKQVEPKKYHNTLNTTQSVNKVSSTKILTIIGYTIHAVFCAIFAMMPTVLLAVELGDLDLHGKGYVALLLLVYVSVFIILFRFARVPPSQIEKSDPNDTHDPTNPHSWLTPGSPHYIEEHETSPLQSYYDSSSDYWNNHHS